MTATTTESFSDAPQPLGNPDLQLRDIIKTLPPACFHKSQRKAWSSVLLSVSAVALGYVSIAIAPWFLLPIAWFFTGTALTGFFVIAHDCGHRSFAKRLWVNDWVGHLLMLPLIYPFHSWRLLHDRHHLHTNKLDVDNAWRPWTIEEFITTGSGMRGVYRQLRGYLWWVASIAHWATLHFNPAHVPTRYQNKVKGSIAAVVVFAAIFFPTLLLTTGIWGVVKFWLFPWLGYHFWMSTFTLVHHTAPEIQFQPTASWNEAEAQLSGTVHCRYPRWVEVLCHNINVHVPHHISVGIPAYNLPLAHQSLAEHWGNHLQERTFSVGLMREIVDRCHLYHPEQAYLAFSEIEK
ncbi:MAG: fatty acid desaturase [Leptolyngbyaceae cyanobacterium SL_7_1]|nr:fatty acid desaturase [Leptolyngbyaceae cyanobacterium SL_7_1]